MQLLIREVVQFLTGNADSRIVFYIAVPSVNDSIWCIWQVVLGFVKGTCYHGFPFLYLDVGTLLFTLRQNICVINGIIDYNSSSMHSCSSLFPDITHSLQNMAPQSAQI